MTASIEGKDLVIRMPLQKPTPSASGKSLTVATTKGIVTSNLTIESKPVKIGVNAFITR